MVQKTVRFETWHSLEAHALHQEYLNCLEYQAYILLAPLLADATTISPDPE